ncbi:hypothetical protein ABIA32_000711 [Streptacidiphilus sp. MAP12-20]|uniref:hypothetical protein n=1 Tax=Streptacidiphilus sp. MAP12-20 TaxID=3156299 RepID=UPI003517FE81
MRPTVATDASACTAGQCRVDAAARRTSRSSPPGRPGRPGRPRRTGDVGADQRSEAEQGELCRLVGRHCESGDTLSAGVPLQDPRVGDLIAVPVTGAYTYALSNNYNGARRPPVVFVSDGEHRAVVRRETYADLMQRDL